jgi:hypothetical protein
VLIEMLSRWQLSKQLLNSIFLAMCNFKGGAPSIRPSLYAMADNLSIRYELRKNRRARP